jgi:DNA ligase (NAD+)
MAFDRKILKDLLDQIDHHDDLYYNQSKTEISDQEYDGLKDRLKSLSKEFKPKTDSQSDEKLSIRIEDALTRVGSPPPKDGKWPKVTHSVSMGSLNKVNFPDELIEWHKKCGSAKTLFITEKLDGISISLKYDNGVLVMGATRGSDGIGEDITRNVKKMKGIPHMLKDTFGKVIDFTGHIRGEIILKHSDWKAHLSDKANPRNAASGTAKRIDGHKAQHLTVMVYTIDGGIEFDREDQAFEYMKLLGFIVPNYSIVSIDEANNLWQKYMDSTRETLDYDIDGLVIRINDRAKQFALGEESNRPKGAIAFKFEAPEARTTITGWYDQVGDTGRITPVAEFNEVELLGAKITRASLHNYSLVKELGVNIGAEVIISRRNDVIPYIEKVTKECNGYYPAPKTCPSCGTSLVSIGEYIVCPNKKDCPPQVIGLINKWIKELGILEWGESILTKLIESGKVEDVYDLYTLKEDDLTSLDRMGEKGAKKLLAELDKFREITLENFLGGLCIDGVATSTAKSVIDAGYDTLDKILKLSTAQFESISGFGEKRAQSFHDGLIENAIRIDSILKAGVTIKARVKGSLTNKSFCFTGSMENPRGVLQQMVEAAGGEVKKSVGKDLNYLVIADPNSTSSKAQAAKKNGTKLISEDEFLKMAVK